MDAGISRGGVFWRYAARSLRLNRTRTVVSVIGIALSCALFTAIFTSVATLYTGLLRAEILTDGTWQVELVNVTREQLERLREDRRITKSYERISYGEALMPRSFQGYWGRYLCVQEWPTSEALDGLKPLPGITEGRAPQGPREIVLADDLRGLTTDKGNWLYDSLPDTGYDGDVPRAAWDGALEIGSTISLALGERRFVDSETGEEAPCLYSVTMYTAASAQGDVISEYLADPTDILTFTVVGFHGSLDVQSYSQWGSSGPGYLGFVSAPAVPVRQTSVYVTTNLQTHEEVSQLISDYTGGAPLSAWGNRGWIDAATPATAAYEHDALLRYQGMGDAGSLWGTLYTLAAILSSVVVLASITLIYNSFSISVSERMRQFGLLSSLGASKRQLRHVVYAEALLLASIGIPIGLAIGLMGTFVVFNIAGEGIGMLIDQQAFSGASISTITVNPVILVVCTALTLLTVFASTVFPAWRASRVSAIEAIRLSRDGRADRERAGRTAAPLSHGTTRGASRGAKPHHGTDVPRLLAHRNLARPGSKGRVAVASLAASVALIIISGSLSHYLDYITKTAENGGSDIEISLNRLLEPGETAADGLAAIVRAYESCKRLDGVTGEGYMIYSALYGSFDPAMLDTDALPESNETYEVPGCDIASDGRAYAAISILFLDEASWGRILKENALDAEDYTDSNHPVAVALNGAQTYNGERYLVHNHFKRTGTARLFTHISSDQQNPLIDIAVDDSGSPIARYEGAGENGVDDYDANGNPLYRELTAPLEQVLEQSYELPVGAIVTTLPGPIKAYASAWPTLMLPASALPAIASESDGLLSDVQAGTMATPFAFHTEEGSIGNTITTFLSFAAARPREAENALSSVMRSDLSGAEWSNTYLTNNAERDRSTHLMAEAVQLFISCFIVTMSLIAVANVFNTITNSIILRRREFAMLKSIGMDERTFWRMIALECASYAWRGLALGLALGGFITYLAYQAMSMSFQGLDFILPLEWLLASFALVMAMLALSTWYALRKAESKSIIAAHRDEAI